MSRPGVRTVRSTVRAPVAACQVVRVALPLLLALAPSWVVAQPQQGSAGAGVESTVGGAVEVGEPGGEVEAVSLLGVELVRPEPGTALRQRQEALLAEALARRAGDAEDRDAWIWVGRRQAYLGRFREAIATFSAAIERFPDEPRLYRHRGHRHLTVRALDRAIADLVRGTELVAGRPDEVEPDGLPNERGIPTSTLQSNLWYHLGLARYLQADFEAALAAYRECLAVSSNPDMLVASSYWLHLTLRRLGRDVEAAAVLEPIEAGMEILENEGYQHLLLAFKGELDPEALLAEAAAEETGIAFPTVAYGVANWHLVEGRPDRAREIFERILATRAWPAFGYLAAEAELARAAGGR